MSTNPYQSPVTSPATPAPLTGPGIDGIPVASQNKRLVNFFLDNIALQVVSMFSGFALGAVYVANAGGNLTPAQAAQLQWVAMGLGFFLSLMYFVVLEGLFKITLGKLATGTRVVNSTGGEASFGQVIGRSLARMIPFEPFSFLFGDTTTGWHDSLSGTRVVDMRKARR